MNQQDIAEYLANLTDAELTARFEEAQSDLEDASAKEPNSEWHQSCFAGFMVLGNELVKRGIRVSPLH